jgi:hypothetical protein
MIYAMRAVFIRATHITTASERDGCPPPARWVGGHTNRRTIRNASATISYDLIVTNSLRTEAEYLEARH